MKRHIIFSAPLLFFLFACDLQTVTELDIPDEKKRLVVNCILEKDSLAYATVWQSQNALDFQRPHTHDTAGNFVTRAAVKLYTTGENEISLYLDPQHPYYRSSSLTNGNLYTLEVSAPGYETITATTTIPEPVQIIDVKSDLIPQSNPHSQRTRIFHVRFKDPAGESNYYALAVTASLRKLGNVPGRVPFPLSIFSIDPGFSDEYYKEVYRKPNVGAYSDMNIVFNDRLFDGDEHTFSVWTPDGGIGQGNKAEYHIFLKSISEEYYNYRITYNLQKEAKKNPLAQPIQVYNNISSGLGILAGSSLSRYVYQVQ
jgi:hypothetical protein